MTLRRYLLLVLASTLWVRNVESGWNNIGILIVENEDGTLMEDSTYDNEVFCMKCYPSLYNFTRGKSSAKRYDLSSLLDIPEVDSCDPKSFDNVDITDKFALLNISVNNNSTTAVKNCSWVDRASIVQASNGMGMLADRIPNSVTKENGTDPSNLEIPVSALLNSRDAERLRKLLNQTKHEGSSRKRLFAIYSPEEKNFDASLFLIMAMAVFTVAAGSFWSGYVKHELRLRQLGHVDPNADQEEAGRRISNNQSNAGNDPDDEERIYEQANGNKQSGHAAEEISLQISPAYIIFFVLLMCGMLVMLYFFFDYLVYVIIGMFCLATTIAVYSCFEPVIMWSYEAECMKCLPVLRIPKCNLYLCIINMELRQALLLAGSIAISAVWLVFRKEDWAWMLQDALGILFSINMLKVLRLPSLKICTILLSTLFVYDIFFVFITPLITKDGKSVMVEVATGGDTGEQLPMVLKVPHLSSTLEFARACGVPYSMLGFGDILVPGLLLSYCHSFDLLVGTPCKLYWVITNIAYTLGIVATFVSLYLMKAAQPALLFLVPFTLVPVFLVSWIRGDLKAMWRGDFAETAEATSRDNSHGTTNTAIRNDESEVNGHSEEGIIENNVLPTKDSNSTIQNGTLHNSSESHQLYEKDENPSSQK